MGELTQLVYLSRASNSLTPDGLQQIHETAVRRNQQDGLTGLLLYDGARFIQALEGERANVEATMARIEADNRHAQIQIAASRPIEARQFGHWAMDCRRTPPGTCSREFLTQVKNDVASVKDAGLQAAFIGFAYLAVR